MKKITQKIVAGMLSLAMVLGCFGGMGVLDTKAADLEVKRVLTVQLVDEDGNEVHEQLALSLSQGLRKKELGSTNENGVGNFEYANLGNNFYEDYITLGLSVNGDNKDYTSEGKEIYFEKDFDSTWYISELDEEDYTGYPQDELSTTLVVKKEIVSKITSVTAEPSVVPKEGSENITLTVKGKNLPDTLYYTTQKPGSQGGWASPDADKTSVPAEATGSDTEKTITVSLPAAAEGQEKWRIEVHITDNRTGTSGAAEIIIVEGATKEQLQAAITEAEKMTEENYGPPASWAAYSEAVNAAKVLLTNGAATGTDYQVAIDEITKAAETLQRIPSREKVRTFEITVLDENNNSVSTEIQSNLKFQLVQGEDICHMSLADGGNITVNADAISNNGFYELKLTDDSGYSCVQRISIRFSEGDVSQKRYVADVLVDNMSVFDWLEPRTTLNIKEADVIPKITSVSMMSALVKNGGQADVKVVGTNLPDNLYYSLSYVKSSGADNSFLYNKGEKTEITASGSDTEKTINITLPEKPADAYAWKIGVAALETDVISSSTTTGEIRIVEEVTPDELQAAIDAAGEKDSSEYTKETWEAYNSAIEEGKKVIAKQEATALERGAALADIKAAENALVLVSATQNRILKIKAIDEDGNPISDLLFELKAFSSTIPLPRTGAEGTATYTMNSTERNDKYEIELKENSKYTCDVSATVDFIVSPSSYYIQKVTVDGTEVNPGEEIIITVKKKM